VQDSGLEAGLERIFGSKTSSRRFAKLEWFLVAFICFHSLSVRGARLIKLAIHK